MSKQIDVTTYFSDPRDAQALATLISIYGGSADMLLNMLQHLAAGLANVADVPEAVFMSGAIGHFQNHKRERPRLTGIIQ